MAEQRPHDTAAAVTDAARALRADLVRAMQDTAQVMGEIAATREKAAAHYRDRARGGGRDSVRYLQQAAEFDQAAARARQFAEQEREQLAKWQQPDGAQDTAG